jgi:hypothetical protein
MILLEKVNDQLNDLFPGYKLLETQPIEIQYIDHQPVNLMLASTKFGYPQNMVIKANIESGDLIECYPTAFNIDVGQKENTVPYYSVDYLGNKTHLYWVIDEHQYKDTDVILRKDLLDNSVNRIYFQCNSVESLRQFCDLDISDNPNGIILYYDRNNMSFNGYITYLKTYLFGHPNYEKLYHQFISNLMVSENK